MYGTLNVALNSLFSIISVRLADAMDLRNLETKEAASPNLI